MIEMTQPCTSKTSDQVSVVSHLPVLAFFSEQEYDKLINVINSQDVKKDSLHVRLSKNSKMET